MLVLITALSGCIQQVNISGDKERAAYAVDRLSDNPVNQFAPVFITYDYDNTDNRIGRPSAQYGNGNEIIYIDHVHPAMFYMVREFSTDKDNYTNYIYRVHFPKVPFSLIPFYLSSGNNVGLIIVVTVDSKDRPVLITAVHTCGCYLAIVPTSYLSNDAFPEKWSSSPINVYGEILPPIIDYREKMNPKVVVHLRPGDHRVMDIEVVGENDPPMGITGAGIIVPLVHTDELEKIPLNDNTTSFYYRSGLLKGHVKGSVKLWESLLLSGISLDLFVGADKAYADPQVTGNHFYTSLKPWNRSASDMWDFARFLRFWGWNL